MPKGAPGHVHNRRLEIRISDELIDAIEGIAISGGETFAQAVRRMLESGCGMQSQERMSKRQIAAALRRLALEIDGE